MKIFQRTDAKTTQRTIAIFRDELQHEKRSFWLAAVFIPLQNLMYIVLLPLLISFFTQSLITNPENAGTPLLYIAGMIVISIIAIVCGHIGFIALFKHQERMTTRLTERALRGLLMHSQGFFSNHKVGSLAGDVNTFSRSYLSVADTIALQASSIIVNFIASLIIVAVIAPLMLPVLFVLTFIVVYDALRSYSKRATYRIERKEMQSRLLGNFSDVLGNQILVRMFGSSKMELEAISKQRHKIESVANKEIAILQQGAETRMGLLFGFQIITLLLCLWLTTNGMLTIAALVFIITYLGRVSGSMFGINGIIRGLEQAFLDAAKITEILDLSIDVVDKPHASKLNIKNPSVHFENVSFAYSDAKQQTIFKDLQLFIPAGQSIGLVGRSGGGKSTLTQLLLRYMDVDNGSIYVDDVPIHEVTQESLRSSISYVPQDPYLFHRSLRENIAYGKTKASDEEIMKAAQQAHAWEFIKKLPHGLDTVVGERGVKLSGGQRQRIAIARAILKDSPIILLDEATSALDSESEKKIQEAFKNLMKGRTSIVIAHRLSTIAKLDRIIVMDSGSIVEDGTHRELLANNGIYASLWAHQSGGFIEE